MRKVVIILFALLVGQVQSQEKHKSEEIALNKANNFVYEGNKLVEKDFTEAEMTYRKAISLQPSTVVGNYNLGNSYYEKGNYEEALFRHQKAIEHASTKAEKHRAYHNIGNILFKNKKCQEAVEAYKNALRNDPTDDETRYNLGLAKICAEQQKDQQDKDDKGDNKDNNDQNQDQENKDQEGENKDNKQGEDTEDKKDGDDEKDKEGEPKDDKKNEDQKNDQGKPKDENKDQAQPQPQPGQLSPQQVKSILEAMNNQEQKVQDKINEEKQKGVKIKTEKDW